MIRKSFLLLAVAALLAAAPVAAAQSRTTEYHKIGVKISAATTFNITLPDGSLVTGKIKSSTGAPVKDAIVFIADAIDGYAGFADGTDASGAFTVPVQPGPKILVVGQPDSASLDPAKFSRLMTKTITGLSIAGDTALGDISLQNGYILSGKITPPAGGGPLLMFTPTIEVFPPTGLILTVSAQTGGTNGLVPDKYAVALPAGSYRLFSRATGAAMTLQGVPMLPRQDKVVIAKDTVKNLTMAKGGFQLSGTLKDSAKKGLDGWLFIVPKTGLLKGWPVQIAQVVKGVFGVLPGMKVKNLFLAAGSYTLGYLPTMYLTTGYAGRATVTYWNLTMPAAAKTLALTAANGFLISGKATNAAGSPVRAFVTAFAPDAPIDPGALGKDFMGAVTDNAGNYRFALPAETFNIYAIPIVNILGQPKPAEMLREQALRVMGPAKR